MPYTINEIISDNNSTEYYKESKGGLVKSYAYCEEPNPNHRQYMEDQGIAIENFNNDPNKIIFGLFDGHGGDQVSKYLQENFALYMKQMMPFNNYFQDFVNLFKTLDEKVKGLNCPDAGSTATIVYVERQNDKKYLYCINVGDSRCIIINKKGIMRLSKDDRVDDPNEKERIIKEGGFIYNGRIHGILMLSRCFGDWGIKNYGVSCEPHIAKIEINDDDLCLVIASDGVWDFMKDEEFKVLMDTKMNSFDICKDIITESLNKGSSDNISCFVINFK
jgi:serine/threonine protein phosphatase PrpC